MHRRLRILTVAAIAGLAIAGCSRSRPTPSAIGVAPSAQSLGPPPSEEECRQFGMELEAAVKANDVRKTNDLFRYEDLLKRCVSDFGLPEKNQRDFMSGARSSLQSGNLGTQICSAVQGGGSYHMLRVHTVAGRPRALFRLLHPDSGLNYHDIIVARFPDGKLGVDDMYIAITGEQVSETVRRLLLPLLARVNQGLLGRLQGKDKEYIANLEQMRQMMAAIQAGRAADAAAIFKKLPQALQEEKFVLVMHMTATAATDENEHTAAAEKLQRLYPNDPCVDLGLIDYYLIKKRFDDCLKSIDRLGTSVGGDVYLTVLRANVHLSAKNFAKATEAAERAVELAPDLQSAYWSRISISLAENKHAETLNWLKKIVARFDVEMDDLTKIPEYAEFAKSPQHSQWIAWYAAHRPKAKP